MPKRAFRSAPRRVVSWNVNGLRACARKGFLELLETSEVDVLCLQERGAPSRNSSPPRSASRTAGTRTFIRRSAPATAASLSTPGMQPDHVETKLGIDEFDIEGRFIAARFGRLSIASVYFPKGSGKDRDNSRVPYKLEFTDAIFDRVSEMRRYGPTLVTGDYNTAHTAIDLARPKGNVKNSGFLPEERDKLTQWTDAGWVDAFRKRHPDEEGHYTWWRQFGGARENNVGWRIDYVFASPSADKAITDAFIWPDDHGIGSLPDGSGPEVGADVSAQHDLHRPVIPCLSGIVMPQRSKRGLSASNAG
ncbi:MAG: exodeoxyribonuclease III [Gammaproteobacteria bacterium]|nr:exodeoxyribonuclease III [Gammaproteobacteria bacterium]